MIDRLERVRRVEVRSEAARPSDTGLTGPGTDASGLSELRLFLPSLACLFSSSVVFFCSEASCDVGSDISPDETGFWFFPLSLLSCLIFPVSGPLTS